MIIGTKFFEIGVVLAALAGLWLHSLVIQCAAGFLMSSQAAVFAPSKYGLLPEILPEKRLSWGNGVLELGTFMAIILGTIAAGIFSSIFPGREYASGISASRPGAGRTRHELRRSPECPPPSRTRTSAGIRWATCSRQIAEIRKDRVLSLAVTGNVYFWFLGSLLLINVVLYGTDVLHVSEAVASRLLVASSLGIGLGSFLAGYLSGGKIEYGLIPLGAIGITITTALLARTGLSVTSVAAHLAILGFFAGFFAVPINALIQHRPPPDRKGAIIAAANLLSFVGIALQPIVQYAMIYLGHPNPARVFLITAILTLGATALHRHPAARFAGAPGALARDAFGLSHPRRGPRQHSRNRRRAFRGQPHVVRRRAAADRLHRPAHPLPDLQGHLRPAVRQALRQADPRDSHFLRTSPARNAALACTRRATRFAPAKSSAFLPRARSPASASCFPSAAEWNAS